MTGAEADAMLDEQGGLCAICRSAPAVHVDHDHGTGAVRALLCFNCNGGLGQFRDDPEILRAAAEYVRFHAMSQRLIAMFHAAGFPSVRAIRVDVAPVGSDRRPGSVRSTGRTSRSRRRKTAGEADG